MQINLQMPFDFCTFATEFPQEAARRRVAREHRWRYRSEPPVYGAPPQGPHRRDTGKYMAR